LLIAISRQYRPIRRIDRNDAVLRRIKAELPRFGQQHSAVRSERQQHRNVTMAFDRPQESLFSRRSAIISKGAIFRPVVVSDPVFCPDNAQWVWFVARPVRDDRRHRAGCHRPWHTVTRINEIADSAKPAAGSVAAS